MFIDDWTITIRSNIAISLITTVEQLIDRSLIAAHKAGALINRGKSKVLLTVRGKRTIILGRTISIDSGGEGHGSIKGFQVACNITLLGRQIQDNAAAEQETSERAHKARAKLAEVQQSILYHRTVPKKVR